MILLKRDKNGKAEVFDVPESILSEAELEKYKTKVATKDCHPEAIDIYKMEYDTAAKRYNDLYNAAWTNFSYIVLLAGGLLTFAGGRFVVSMTVFLACLPLLFWWTATFEPLNRYGKKVATELCRIEKALNALFISNDLPEKARGGLSHFQNFEQRGKSGIGRVWRVQYVVRVAIAIIGVVTVICLTYLIQHWRRNEAVIVREKPAVMLNVVPTPSPTPSPKSTNGE